jgi:outer membrane murein-binding lipoprotein Lpp
MRKLLFFIAVSASILFTGCADTANSNDVTVVPDRVLTSSGVEDEKIFKATGEVVVFFQPSREKITSWEGDKDALVKSIEAFSTTVASAQKSLSEMGISSYVTDKSDIKINISEQKFFVVNAGASKDGFGFIMTKMGNEPKVSLGAFTPEQVVEQSKAFYNK